MSAFGTPDLSIVQQRQQLVLFAPRFSCVPLPEPVVGPPQPLQHLPLQHVVIRVPASDSLSFVVFECPKEELAEQGLALTRCAHLHSQRGHSHQGPQPDLTSKRSLQLNLV